MRGKQALAAALARRASVATADPEVLPMPDRAFELHVLATFPNVMPCVACGRGDIRHRRCAPCDAVAEMMFDLKQEYHKQTRDAASDDKNKDEPSSSGDRVIRDLRDVKHPKGKVPSCRPSSGGGGIRMPRAPGLGLRGRGRPPGRLPRPGSLVRRRLGSLASPPGSRRVWVRPLRVTVQHLLRLSGPPWRAAARQECRAHRGVAALPRRT